MPALINSTVEPSLVFAHPAHVVSRMTALAQIVTALVCCLIWLETHSGKDSREDLSTVHALPVFDASS